MQHFGKKLALFVFSILAMNTQSLDAQYELEHEFNFKNTLEQQEKYILTFDEFIAGNKGDLKVDYISPEELKEYFDEEKKVYLLDLRDSKAYQVSHIEKSRNIEFDNFNSEKIWMIPKRSKVVLYCTMGEYSVKVARYLSYLGCKDVSVLHLSIVGWANAGYTLYDGGNHPTNRVMVDNRNQAASLKKGKAILN